MIPPPIAGETLSGWVSCLGEIYGLPADRLLRGVGASPLRQLRWLDIASSYRVLAALSAQTGVAVAFMRERMTFHRLERELVPTVVASSGLAAAVWSRRKLRGGWSSVYAGLRPGGSPVSNNIHRR